MEPMRDLGIRIPTGAVAAQVIPPDPDQIMMAGVAPVSMGERLGWLANQPIQPRRQQRRLDIGFWNPTRDQIEMF